MTDEELAHLKELWAADAIRRGEHIGPGITIRALLAEVERLQAREATLLAEVEPWREIGRAVATSEVDQRSLDEWIKLPVRADAFVRKARALLGMGEREAQS